MQVTVGPQTAWGQGAAKFAELAAEKTGGRIRIKPYFGSQLLKGAQLNAAQMVADGAIDLAFESTINTAPVIAELNLFSIPFFIQSHAELDRVENGEAGQLLFAAMRKKGLEPLAWGENGFRQLTNSKRPIRAPADLPGLKIRVVGSPLFIETFRQFGADPINMNWADAVTAFQQGTVDGQENPVNILVAVQIFQYQKHLTLWNYMADPLIIYWCRKDWDRFPPDIRRALSDAATEAGLFQKALSRVGLDGGVSLEILKNRFHTAPEIPDPLRYLREHGMEIVTLTDDEHRRFMAAARTVEEKWADKVGRAVYQAAQKDLGR